MKKTISPLTFARLCLSGAIAGAALAGLVSPLIGMDSSHAQQLIGGALGVSAVVAFKMTHVI
jgi:hypothetical protein